MLIYNNNLKAVPQNGGWLTFPIFFYIFSISIIYAQLTGSGRVEITNIKTEAQACEEAKEIALKKYHTITNEKKHVSLDNENLHKYKGKHLLGIKEITWSQEDST